MRKLLIDSVLLLILLAPACGPYGLTVGSDVATDAPPAQDTAATEVTQDTAPMPDLFDGSRLAWALMYPEQDHVWYGLTGLDLGEAYYLFMVGFRGAVARYESQTDIWKDISLTIDSSLHGVWAANSNTLFVCGEGGALHRWIRPEGASYAEWTDLGTVLGVTADLHAIHGLSESRVWAVGSEGTVLRYNGATWVALSRSMLQLADGEAIDFHGVYAVSEDDVVIVGTGLVLECTMDACVRQDMEGAEFLSVAGGGDVVWAGAAGALWVRREGAWENPWAPNYYDFSALWVDEAGAVFATGPHKGQGSLVWFGSGDPWMEIDVNSPDDIPEQWAVTPNTQVTGLWGRSTEDLFAVTQQEQILHYFIHP